MGLLDQLGGMLGGEPQQAIGRMMGGGGKPHDPQSGDHHAFGQMMGQASDDDLSSTFSHAARGMDGQAYRDHVTPGVGGTDPLGGLGQGGLGAIAGALLSNLGGSGQNTGGGMGGGTGGGMASLLGRIPGLSQTDPNRTSSHDVAALADYTRQHHPDAFGRAAAQVGRKDPGLLQQLLGNPAMMSAAAALASKFMSRK